MSIVLQEKLKLRTESIRELTHLELDHNQQFVSNSWSPLRKYKEGMIVYVASDDISITGVVTGGSSFSLSWWRANSDHGPDTVFDISKWDPIGAQAVTGEISVKDDDTSLPPTAATLLDFGDNLEVVMIGNTAHINVIGDTISPWQTNSGSSEVYYLDTVLIGISNPYTSDKLQIVGNVWISGSISLGGTIDGVDLGAFYSNYGIHKHYISNSLLPGVHTQMADVSISGLSNGHVLTYNGITQRWTNQAPSMGIHTLGSHTDVSILSPAVNQFLIYNGTTWGNISITTNSSTGLSSPLSHNHNSLYYTTTQLQTSGLSSIHWDNITNVPSNSPSNESYLLVQPPVGVSLTDYRILSSDSTINITDPGPGGNLILNVVPRETVQKVTVYNNSIPEGDFSNIDFISSPTVQFIFSQITGGDYIEVSAEVIESALSSSFLLLTDTPNSYSGQVNKIVKVNSTETGLEFIENMIPVTYLELATLIGTSNLIPGQYYLITDFAQAYNIFDGGTNDVIEAQVGTLEPLIVYALSTKKLERVAYSPNYPNDIIYYEPTGVNVTTDIGYSDGSGALVADFKGVIEFRHDTKQNISTWYDFRNIKFRRWAVDCAVYDAGTAYTLKDVLKGSDGKIYKCISDVIAGQGDPSTNATNWIIWNDITADAYISWTADGSMFAIGNITPTNLIFDTATYQDVYTFGDWYKHVNNVTIGKNELAILLNNGVYTTLNNIVFKTQDNAYTCFSNEIGESYNNTIGSGFYYNFIGSDFYANTIGSGFNSNTIGSGFNSNTIGSGFYYNSIGSDFYANTIGSGFNSNTIGSGFNSNTIGDSFSSNTIGSSFGNNTIENGFGGNTIGSNFGGNTIENDFFSNTIENGFGGNTIGSSFGGNTIENDFFSNTIENGFGGNTIGSSFGNNTIGSNFSSNTIGNGFSGNTIGNNFYSNTIGNGFSGNTIGNNFYSNTIGNDFYGNTVGDYFYGNTVGDYFSSNTIGNGFSGNTIGNNFYSNTIGNGFSGNTIGSNFYDNTLGNNCTNLTFQNNCKFYNNAAVDGFKNCVFENEIDIHAVDFTSATHIKAIYGTVVFYNSANVIKLRCFDSSDVLTIVAVNA